MAANAHLRRLIALSVAAAIVTIAMKTTAYLLTQSAGLLSDALESGVNLLAAVAAYLSLGYSSRPADPTHAFGHEKIEFFSSGLEGTLVCVAGLGTAWYAVGRLIAPQPLTDLGLGMAIAAAAAGVNCAVGLLLVRAGRKADSLLVEADGQHLMSDVLTTGVVLLGLGLVWLTGVPQLDALLALGVGLHIVTTGFRLIRRSFDGLMDHALAPEEVERIRGLIRAALPAGADFHLLRTRRAGSRPFADFHILVPGSMSLAAAHEIADTVEEKLRTALPDLEVTTHVEPIEDLKSWEKERLEQLGEPTEPSRTIAQ